MFRSFKTSFATLSLALAAVGTAPASVPNLFSYQGRIANTTQTSASLTVSLWSAASGGTLLFQETQNNVALSDGVFSILVGAATGGGVPDTVSVGNVWLGLSINGAAELTPRTRLASVPFAIRAEGAQSLVIPGSGTIAATIGSDGHLFVDGKIEMGAATDNGGVLTVSNVADVVTVRLDGADSGGTGGRVELSNGAATNVNTVIFDANDTNDGAMWLYDANNFESVRIHSDRINNAPELAMFTGTTAGQLRETVQLTANQETTGFGAGALILRRVSDPAVSATSTVELKATSYNQLGDPGDGGYLALKYTDGSPVFTVQAGSTGAISPAFMELRAAGSANDRRLYATPNSLTYYNSSNDATVTLSGSTGDATFTGELTVGVLTITGGADLSEQFDIRTPSASAAVEPGMVVCIDPKNPGQLVLSGKAYDRTVAGVISGAGGVKPGMMMSQHGSIANGKHPGALTGRVWVNCDATSGAVEPGDLLTTSSTPGHAMKVGEAAQGVGATIGKAMTRLEAGQRGLVRVLVNLQ